MTNLEPNFLFLRNPFKWCVSWHLQHGRVVVAVFYRNLNSTEQGPKSAKAVPIVNQRCSILVKEQQEPKEPSSGTFCWNLASFGNSRRALVCPCCCAVGKIDTLRLLKHLVSYTAPTLGLCWAQNWVLDNSVMRKRWCAATSKSLLDPLLDSQNNVPAGFCVCLKWMCQASPKRSSVQFKPWERDVQLNSSAEQTNQKLQLQQVCTKIIATKHSPKLSLPNSASWAGPRSRLETGQLHRRRFRRMNSWTRPKTSRLAPHWDVCGGPPWNPTLPYLSQKQWSIPQNTSSKVRVLSEFTGHRHCISGKRGQQPETWLSLLATNLLMALQEAPGSTEEKHSVRKDDGLVSVNFLFHCLKPQLTMHREHSIVSSS